MMRFVVTGCGRSGTASVAAALNEAGVKCAHEHVFTPTGFVGFGDFDGDASWFAAGSDVPPDLAVVHLVRDPRAVAASFYRLGLFGRPPWRSLLRHRRSPIAIARFMAHTGTFRDRIRYISAQRQLVMAHTSVFTVKDESLRCLRYWREWNELAERLDDGRPYLRVRIEDKPWDEIGRFLGVRIAGEQWTNLKSDYPPRPFPDRDLDEATRSLAARYGYS